MLEMTLLCQIIQACTSTRIFYLKLDIWWDFFQFHLSSWLKIILWFYNGTNKKGPIRNGIEVSL